MRKNVQSRVLGQSFSTRTMEKLSAMLQQCCGECGIFMLNDLNAEVPHLNVEEIEKTDFLFPILGHPSLTVLYDL